MPVWAWFLIDLSLAVLGLLVLAWLAWDLYFKFTKITKESSKLQEAISLLQEQLTNSQPYSEPANNLGDEPAKLTQAWLARKSHHEQEKSAKQRRLIARFSKRK
jgi:hypothetical protein